MRCLIVHYHCKYNDKLTWELPVELVQSATSTLGEYQRLCQPIDIDTYNKIKAPFKCTDGDVSQGCDFHNGRWKHDCGKCVSAKVRADLIGFWDGQFQEAAFKDDMHKVCGNSYRMQRPITLSKDDTKRLDSLSYWYKSKRSPYRHILWDRAHTPNPSAYISDSSPVKYWLGPIIHWYKCPLCRQMFGEFMSYHWHLYH